jgi:hypothetical protein
MFTGIKDGETGQSILAGKEVTGFSTEGPRSNVSSSTFSRAQNSSTSAANARVISAMWWREKVIAFACRWPSGAAGALSRLLPLHLLGASYAACLTAHAWSGHEQNP